MFVYLSYLETVFWPYFSVSIMGITISNGECHFFLETRNRHSKVDIIYIVLSFSISRNVIPEVYILYRTRSQHLFVGQDVSIPLFFLISFIDLLTKCVCQYYVWMGGKETNPDKKVELFCLKGTVTRLKWEGKRKFL